MIELTYQDESPGDLRFHLVRGRVCPSRFTVVAEATARCGDTVVEARIIGASHAIVYDLGGEKFTEVLACSTPELLGETLASGAVADVERGLDAQLTEQANYSIRATVLHGDQAVRAVEDLEAAGRVDDAAPNKAALRFAFPSQTEGGVQAVTLLRVTLQGMSLTVETAHAYPQADACVLTKTHIGARAGREEMPR